MAKFHDLGDRVRIFTSVPFTNVEGDTVDPDVVTFRIRYPDGESDQFVYESNPEVERSDAGSYYMDVNIDQAGDWRYRIEGMADNEDYMGAAENSFVVRRSWVLD